MINNDWLIDEKYLMQNWICPPECIIYLAIAVVNPNGTAWHSMCTGRTAPNRHSTLSTTTLQSNYTSHPTLDGERATRPTFRMHRVPPCRAAPSTHVHDLTLGVPKVDTLQTCITPTRLLWTLDDAHTTLPTQLGVRISAD